MAQRRTDHVRPIEILVTDEQLALLRALDFPGTAAILAAPVPSEEGLLLHMTRAQLEDFLGWVAGEANHERKKRRADLLNDIADEMEHALSAHRPLR